MDSTKEDIRKILLLHENPEKVLADYIEAKVAEESKGRFTNGLLLGLFIMFFLLTTIFLFPWKTF